MRWLLKRFRKRSTRMPNTDQSNAEARRRLSLVGRNELAATLPVAPWRRFIAQFASPLVLLLIAATLISFVVWAIERETAIPYEALTIMVIVIANAGLGYFQEARAEAAIAGLQKMTSAQATVLRDSVRVVVPVAEIVPGDVLIVGEGAIVPADARVIHSVSLRTMEAALTGESEPVSKDVAPVAADAATADRSNMLFAGTAVAFGHGRAVVTATGMRAEIGRIAGLLAQTVDEKTPLQAELDRTGRILGVIVIAIALVVGATLLLMQQDFSLTVLTTVLLFTIALAVAAVPEGLSAITTVVLSLGMQRMARRNVIVRRLSAVETLGAATVICTDKTGTLTKNEMTVRALGDRRWSRGFHRLRLRRARRSARKWATGGRPGAHARNRTSAQRGLCLEQCRTGRARRPAGRDRRSDRGRAEGRSRQGRSVARAHVRVLRAGG